MDLRSRKIVVLSLAYGGDTVKGYFRKVVVLNWILKYPVDGHILNRSAVSGAEHKVAVIEFVTKQLFEFDHLFPAIHQHFNIRSAAIEGARQHSN